MSFLKGFEGSVTLPTGFAGHVVGWTSNLDIRTKEVTPLGSKPAQRTIVGYDWTGTIAIEAEENAASKNLHPLVFTDLDAFSGTVILKASTGTYYSANVILKPTINLNAHDTGVATLNFELMNGDVTVVWDVTS